MTEEQIKHQIEYLRSQKENPTGFYRQYLVNLYHLFYNGAKKNGTDWCPNVGIYTMVKAAYANIPGEHESSYRVRKGKEDLEKLGYIKDCNVDGEWRTYILKELDF